ncbi:streptomycin 6-kinase [Friedmanniella endophytica]|uniref:Streptomycin 6-kinase n=1 Tax=Microlunatus kandeliicorticis TaxID=1759536 RepID=A0A7W3IUT9_9ACTN|nr:aminoglycoside phosphotransferase family protein [Microlunatus kandeliicorticis]MBA8795662.1 streptomycin 6-kinase [Microlunatus kandeliicorticis]
MITVPRPFAELVARREGAAGASWLANLPTLVDDLLDRFGCRPDGPPGFGGVGLVVPVRRDDEPAVLKVSMPHPGNVGEAAALRLLGGRGAVRLLDDDPERYALLLERVGPAALTILEDRPDAVIEIAGALARRLAVLVPPGRGSGLTRLADTCPGWHDQLDHQLSAYPDALPAAAVRRARATIDLLAGDRTSTLLHGDLHAGNVLAAGREPWLAIDPKGWTGTAAHDTFTVVAAGREGLRGLDAAGLATELDRRIRRFAGVAGLDVELCRACVQARAVSSLLYQLEQPQGDWFDLTLLRVAATAG